MLLSALLLAPPVPALAAPGDLDPSFDGDGRVLTDFGAFEVASAVVGQPDGKLVAAGSTFSSVNANIVESDVVLARYNRDGSLDRSFGVAGRVVTDLGGRTEQIGALVVQPDGKLVIAGGRFIDPASDLILARYNADGSLDPSFGVGGLAVIPGPFRAGGLVLQPDGKLVVKSFRLLVRLHADGTLDESFGGDGAVVSDVVSSLESTSALVLQADGKLVTAGETISCIAITPCSLRNFALKRFNPDGSPDASFGFGGLVVTDFGEESRANALVLQADGKLVAAGALNNNTGHDRVLARYHSNGSLDTSFGTGGVVLTDGAGTDGWRALVLQTDGKLMIAGGNGAGLTSLLARHNPDGSPDASFGSGGAVALSDLRLDETIALQSDGKLLAGGFGSSSGDADFALVRVLTTNERPERLPKCRGRPATILGTSGSDTLRGTSGPDVILGLAGNDTIRGLEGNDTICGGPGRDRLIGNEGNDRLFGERGNDKLFGDKGRDSLDGGNGRDACRSGERARRCEGKPASSKPTSGERPKDPPKPPCPQVSNFPFPCS